MHTPTIISSMIAEASRLANLAHLNQRRKVTGLPYIIHPYRVALLVEQAGGTEVQIAAAWCHDVLEDCPDFRVLAEETLPANVLALVRQLTKREISPGKRVKGEAFLAELQLMTPEAQMIKLADRIDNLRDGIASMPKAWLAPYLDESRRLLTICQGASVGLADVLEDTIHMACRHLEAA